MRSSPFQAVLEYSTTLNKVATGTFIASPGAVMLIGWRIGPVDLLLNPIMDLPFHGGSGALTFAPAERVAYNLSETWALAVEHYADYGRFADFEPLRRQYHALYGVIDYSRDPFSLEFGIGHGFTAVSEPLILKLILTHSF